MQILFAQGVAPYKNKTHNPSNSNGANEMAEMEFKGTPGPWKMGQTRHTYEEALLSDSDAIVASAAWDGGSSCHLAIDNEADARLIEAAPDLLEALYAVVSVLPETLKQHDLLDGVRDALRKALQS